jgi:tetratricopeptide (TPR) repeat protein
MNNVASQINKSNELYLLGNHKAAIEVLRKLLVSNPSDYDVLVNLGANYRAINKPYEAMDYFLKAIKEEPKKATAYNNLGNILNQLKRYEEAVDSYVKAIRIDPSIKHVHHNLGGVLYKLNFFDEAIKIYQSAKDRSADSEILQCILGKKDYDKFFDEVRYLSNKTSQVKVAAISSYASEKLGVKDPYNFCPNPLESVMYKKIDKQEFTNNKIIKELVNIGNDIGSSKRYQSLIKNGQQSSDNFFEKNGKLGQQFFKYVFKLTEDYKNLFIDNRSSGIIKHWPRNPKMNGWFISMKNEGFLENHNHSEGWVSGSIYLKIPNNLKNNEGDIKFSSFSKDYPEINNKVLSSKTLTLETGGIIIFPSSLYHSTIPFESNEKRITFAFDLNP